MKTVFLGAETIAANALIILNKHNKTILTYDRLVKYAHVIQSQLSKTYSVISLIDGRYINSLREYHSDYFRVEGDSPYSAISIQKGMPIESFKEMYYYSVSDAKISDILASEMAEEALLENT